MTEEEIRQKDAHEAEILAVQLIESNPEVGHGTWVAVFSKIIAVTYVHSGFSWDDYRQDQEECAGHYKKLWEQQNG